MDTAEHEGGNQDAAMHPSAADPTPREAANDSLRNETTPASAADLAIPDFTDFDIPSAVEIGPEGGSGHGQSGRLGSWRGIGRFDGLGSSSDLLTEIAVEACLSPQAVRALQKAEPVVVLVVVPSAAWVGPVHGVFRRIGGHRTQFVKRIAPPRSSATAADPDTEAADLVAGGRPVVAITPDRSWITSLLLAAADHLVVVKPLDAVQIGLAIRVWCGRRARPAVIARDLTGLDLPDVAAAIRPGSTPRSCIERIRRASSIRVGPSDAQATMPLDQLTGYGEAHVWATRTAGDIARVRRGELSASALEGAVLFGPPGTGKTTLARALAQASDVVCIETSVGQWFANSPGYLDSVIKQIMQFCDQLELSAKRDGCSIGFCDELDALPNRTLLDGRSASWWNPVITFYLMRVEQLRKTGVVLIAATNHLDRIDPALLRPGRFDRQFFVGPPDEVGRLGILRSHLGDDLTESDLRPASRLSHGMTGAVLAGCVRAARRRADIAGRPMQLDDLLTEITPADHRPATFLRSIALHEAGHAIIGHRLGFFIEQVTLQAGATHEGATLLRIPDPMPDRAGLERQVIGLLAGRAADAILGGKVTAGAGTDLREATRLLAALHASFGLGSTLRAVVDQGQAAVLLREDPDLAQLVEADLHRLQTRAEVLVRADRLAILKLVEALLACRVVTGAEVTAIADAHRPRIRVTATRGERRVIP